ncbi:hypothetical protein SNE40_016138 [Patella caerulea]|uniref:TRIM56 n=1 Tax=Patella caerulea TaxID=87958 RepID=A0AAN8J870_PATCE
MADQEDNCSICLNILTEPKIIDCGHLFCGDCLEDYYTKKCSKSKNFPCPLCRHNVDVPEGGIKMFPSTYSKKRKIDRESAAGPSTSRSTEGEIMDVVTGVFSCDACKSCDSEIYKCIECNKYMCCSCKNTRHDAFFTDHHVFIVQHQDKQTRGSRRHCTQHTSNKLEFYCKDCNLAVCKTCLTPAHRDHDTLEIYDYWVEVEDELKKLKDDLEIKSSEFEKYVVEVNKKIETMNQSARTSRNKIDQHVKNICDVVFQRGEKLKDDLKKTLLEDEQKMKKIVDGTTDLIGRMAKMRQNISDILIGDCVDDIGDVLTFMKHQRDGWESRDRSSLPDVTSEHHTESFVLNHASLNEIVGEFRVARLTKTTLEKHCFDYEAMKNKKNEWFYGPACILQDCSLNIRAKYNNLSKCINFGLGVTVGDNVNKSTIKYCKVNATVTLTCAFAYSGNKNPRIETLTKTFTPPFGELSWDEDNKLQYGSSIACTTTVGITMTTVL